MREMECRPSFEVDSGQIELTYSVVRIQLSDNNFAVQIRPFDFVCRARFQRNKKMVFLQLLQSLGPFMFGNSPTAEIPA